MVGNLSTFHNSQVCTTKAYGCNYLICCNTYMTCYQEPVNDTMLASITVTKIQAGNFSIL